MRITLQTMHNVSYKISEKSRVRDQINIEKLMSEVVGENVIDMSNIDCDAMCAIRVDYTTNYTVKQLGMILDYYDIPKRNLKKDDIVNQIILYESDTFNKINVERRKELWRNVKELKQDNFFAKYVIIDL